MVSNAKTSGFQYKNQWFPMQKPVVSNTKTSGLHDANRWFLISFLSN